MGQTWEMDCGGILDIFYKKQIPCSVFRDAYKEDILLDRPIFSFRVFKEYFSDKFNKYDTVYDMFEKLFGEYAVITMKYFVID